jgi:hypothetical protein
VVVLLLPLLQADSGKFPSSITKTVTVVPVVQGSGSKSQAYSLQLAQRMSVVLKLRNAMFQEVYSSRTG